MKKLTVLLCMVFLLILAGCDSREPQSTTIPAGTTTAALCSHAFAEATCLTPKTCSLCGETEGSPLGHSTVTDPAVAATCIAAGMTEGSHCSRCNTVLTQPSQLPAAGHSYEDGKCGICSTLTPSEGLGITLHESGAYYQVTGLGLCQDPVVILPNFHNGLPVKAVGANCFKNSNVIQRVIIPEGITEIGDFAFYECGNLVSVALPDSLTSLGNAAFYGCWKMTSIKLPEGITSIPESAFERSGLTSIEFPDSMLRIGKYAFRYTSKLTSVDFNKVRRVGEESFAACGIVDLNIPNALFIDKGAFSACHNLTTVTVPGSLTNLGDNAFAMCHQLTHAVVSEGITQLSSSMFAYCTALTHVELPDSLTGIGDGAFYGCEKLGSMVIPKGVTSLGHNVFAYCDPMTQITYEGTLSQWKDMVRHTPTWNHASYVTEIICSDGSIPQTPFFS